MRHDPDLQCVIARLVKILCGLVLTSSAVFELRAEPPQVDGAPAKREEAASEPRQLFKGTVVLLKDALSRRGLTVADEMASQAVLETPDGELIPLMADWRGRAFFQDERLRDRPVELVGYRRRGLPYLFVLMVFTFDDAGKRQYTDYWCDVCSIPMYEIQPCECCQGEIRLRFQAQELPAYLNTIPATTPPTKSSP